MVTMDGVMLRFDPAGELTIYQVEEASKKLSGLFAGAKSVLIDLSHNDKIDTAGFQLIVSVIQSCKSCDKECTLESVGGSAENFMALFGYEWDAECKGEL